MTTHADLSGRIDAHLRRAARRVRARRLVVTLSVAGLVLAVIGAAAASWEAARALAGLPGDAETLTAPLRPWLVAAVLLACVVAWTRGVSRAALARDVDRRLGLEDRTASALAVTDGAVTSALAERLLADATATLDAARPELDRAFPARPRGALLRILTIASVLVAVWVALVLASRLLGSEGGGRGVPLLPGQAPVPGEVAPDDEPLPGPGDAPDPVDEPDDPEPDASVPPEPPQQPEATAPEPQPPDQPPPPAGPQATAELVMSSDVFSPGEDVLALGVARPGAGLEAPAGFVLSVEVDGHVLGTGQTTALSPGEERGTLTPIRIGRLAGAPDVLQPGEHEAALLLEPEGGGPVVRSEPQRFRIRGDQDGDSNKEAPPPPEQGPQPQPDEQPEAPPPPPPPQEGGGDGGEEPPPEEAPPPPLPEQTERKVVVPLFDEGEEIEKVGPRLVLVPEGGPDAPPRRVPLEEAWEEARRRAEAAVERAGVREEDREIVRRYFERLRRLAESQR